MGSEFLSGKLDRLRKQYTSTFLEGSFYFTLATSFTRLNLAKKKKTPRKDFQRVIEKRI